MITWPEYSKACPSDFREKILKESPPGSFWVNQKGERFPFAKVCLFQNVLPPKLVTARDTLEDLPNPPRFRAALSLYELERFLEKIGETQEGLLSFCGEWTLRFMEAEDVYC